MIVKTKDQDSILFKQLERLTESDRDYWSFKGNSRREHGHGLFQYPAMMVPQLASSILDQACKVHPEIDCVGDPFSGSGTIITESMMRGLSFTGTDINPLAILLCRVKCGPFFIEELKAKANELVFRIGEDASDSVQVNFEKIDKWFSKEIQIDLSKIRRAIIKEEDLWARRFFWIALAETVRATSNSRTSTFKLHVRSKEDLEARNLNALIQFKRFLERNLLNFEEQERILRESGKLVNGKYQGNINVLFGDIRSAKDLGKCDIIITSPPYGDNATTVPYGQYSYLPLQWIDLNDIDEKVTSDYLSSTNAIDSKSLGGRKKLNDLDMKQLMDASQSFEKYIKQLEELSKNKAVRVTAFFRDLDLSLDRILDSLNPGGLMVWTLGNRKVGGIQVPLDQILEELLKNHGAKLLCKLSRKIPSKRMASKNKTGETMSSENILVMRKSF